MTAAPTVLGINRTQDASVTLMSGSDVVCAIQKERLTRQKHHWGKLDDFRHCYGPRLACLKQPIDVLVESYSSDRELENLPSYDRELEETLNFSPNCRRARISHHLAHLYSVFYPSPFEEAAVLIVDGQGSPVHQFTESWSGAHASPGHWREVSSFYRAARDPVANGGIECVGKQLWDCDDERYDGLGMFYYFLTQAVFPGEGNEGKVMGLAPHGDPHALGLPALEVNGPHVAVPEGWREILRERERFRYRPGNGSGARPGFDARFGDAANLAAAGQRAFEEALLALARWLHAETGAKNLCFAGGTALNCSANYRLLRETPFRRLFIPPAPSDAGTSLGCAVYGLTELLKADCQYRWQQDFLGPPPDAAEIETALGDATDFVIEKPRDLCGEIVDLLCKTKVIGLFQGRSEFGPRALGHRSIIADARRGEVRDWINSRVKGREWFRPLAPIVLLEQSERFFDISEPSPFMQFAASVRRDAAEIIPAVTHVDLTARLQTVGNGDDPFLRQLLERFNDRTGVPVLLNTSFNGMNEPIVESPQEAIRSFGRMPMHALVMPPYLLRKRVEPEAIPVGTRN